MKNELLDHPAVEAWRRARPGAACPTRVETVVKGRSNATFRLHHGDGIAPTIAKRRWLGCVEPEHLIYKQVLPLLPVPPVDCRGFVSDEDPERAWLFVEDVGGEPYANDQREHCREAARWLAAVHTSAMKPSLEALLADRGPDHYFGQLRAAITALNGSAGGEDFSDEDRRTLSAVLQGLDELERRWQVLEAWCDAMPRTLVHGDFVAKNCRIRNADGVRRMIVFDWETAGWGVPAVDLATNRFGNFGVALDRDTYVKEMRQAWPDVGPREAERAAQVGDALRVIAAIEWACQSLAYAWVVNAELRWYLPHLEEAVSLVRRVARSSAHQRAVVR